MGCMVGSSEYLLESWIGLRSFGKRSVGVMFDIQDLCDVDMSKNLEELPRLYIMRLFTNHVGNVRKIDSPPRHLSHLSSHSGCDPKAGNIELNPFSQRGASLAPESHPAPKVPFGLRSSTPKPRAPPFSWPLGPSFPGSVGTSFKLSHPVHHIIRASSSLTSTGHSGVFSLSTSFAPSPLASSDEPLQSLRAHRSLLLAR